MKHRIWLVLGILTLGLLAGCGTTRGPERDINDPTNSLIFGHVDMEGAPTDASTATVMQVAPPSDTPYWMMGVRDGMFYGSYFPPASYQLTSFAGSHFIRGQHRYNFPRQGNQTSLRIVKPGIYFLGSFKYKDVKTGFFEQGRFSLEKVKTPTEAQLLRRILEDDDIKTSAWAKRIRARLAELKS